MSVLMLLLFPIGLFLYFYVEKNERSSYQKLFDDFGAKIEADTSLDKAEKKERYIRMLKSNGYSIIKISDTSIYAEKKIFGIGLFFIATGVLYLVGALLYLAYFYWIQKPHRVEYKMDTSNNSIPHSEHLSV